MPKGRSGLLQWSEEEDDLLQSLYATHGAKWSLIAQSLKTKESKQCRRRWKAFQDAQHQKVGDWQPDEDEKLIQGQQLHGNRWTKIAEMVGGRTDNAVKNRWAALCKKQPALLRGQQTGTSPAGSHGGAPATRRSARPLGQPLPEQSSSSDRDTARGTSPSSSSDPSLPVRRNRRKPGYTVSRQQGMPSVGDTPAAPGAGCRGSRLRATTRAGDPLPPTEELRSHSNQGSGSLSVPGHRRPGHPHFGSLSVHVPDPADAPPSDPSNSSGRTPGSVSIRVFKELLTAEEQRAVKELNEMEIPVNIQLENDLITAPPQPTSRHTNRPARPSSSRGTGASSLSFEQWKKEEVSPQQSQLQRPSSDSPSELDDLVRWLHTGGTPLEAGTRARAYLGARQATRQYGRSNTPRTQALLEQHRQVLAKLLASASQLQQQCPPDPTLHPALAQQFCHNLWQPHHQHLAAASLQQQQQQAQAQQQVMHPLPPPAHSTRSSAVETSARRWDEAGSGPRCGPTFMGGLPGLQQVHPWSSLPPAAAMASAAAAPTCAGMGEQGDKAGPHQAAAAAQVLGEDLGEALPLGFSDSPRVPVVISPTFSSQELNILLEEGVIYHLLKVQSPTGFIPEALGESPVSDLASGREELPTAELQLLADEAGRGPQIEGRTEADDPEFVRNPKRTRLA